MCGRYTLVNLKEFTDLFPGFINFAAVPPPRYNIAPTQPVAAVLNMQKPAVELLHWGLVPSWAKDQSVGGRMINARAETLADKPAFRNAMRSRRCLIPASGFYEWKLADGRGKTPLYIYLRDNAPFAFAGLWEDWHTPDGTQLRSCTIITTAANDLLASLHERMPVILPREHYETWLEPAEVAPNRLQPLLQPLPAEMMALHPVSTRVNSPKFDEPACIDHVEPVSKGLFDAL